MFTVSYPLCEESKRKFVFSYTCRKHEIKEEGGHAKVMKQVCGRPGSSSMPSPWIGGEAEEEEGQATDSSFLEEVLVHFPWAKVALLYALSNSSSRLK